MYEMSCSEHCRKFNSIQLITKGSYSTCAREFHRFRDSARHKPLNRDQLHLDETVQVGQVPAEAVTGQETVSASLPDALAGRDMEPHSPAHTCAAASDPSY